MNTQRAREIAAAYGMKLEYTNYDEGNKRMWYLSISTENPAWKHTQIPQDFSCGEMREMTIAHFNHYCSYMLAQAESA